MKNEPAPSRLAQAAPRRRLATRWITAALGLAATGLLAWWFFLRTPAPVRAAAPPRLAVQVARVTERAMPVLLQSVGKVVAQASVEVRPQVAGVLRQVLIQDGARVVAGQKLFVLDAQPLNAALAQAQAQAARDNALAADAAAAQARLKPLADKEYVSAREYEQAVTSRIAAQAAATATRTQIEQARIALAYATITTPIAGRAGAVQVKVGNLVSANGTEPLVVINAISPVEVGFSLPQAEARRLRDAMAAAGATAPLTVQAHDSLTQQLRARGELVFIDNTLDPASGTIAAKARFANTDEALWPGEFYAIRVTLATEAAALTIPERALQQGQAGPYVYVMDAGVARLRTIEVSRVLDGVAVVAAGLKAGDSVLTSLPNNLRDGAAVRVEGAASAASGAARSASRPERAGSAAGSGGRRARTP
jgi:membrane fusion protein, multidrug efflux system